MALGCGFTAQELCSKELMEFGPSCPPPFPRLLPLSAGSAVSSAASHRVKKAVREAWGAPRAGAATGTFTEITSNLSSCITLISFFLLHFCWFSMIFFLIDNGKE